VVFRKCFRKTLANREFRTWITRVSKCTRSLKFNLNNRLIIWSQALKFWLRINQIVVIWCTNRIRQVRDKISKTTFKSKFSTYKCNRRSLWKTNCKELLTTLLTSPNSSKTMMNLKRNLWTSTKKYRRMIKRMVIKNIGSINSKSSRLFRVQQMLWIQQSLEMKVRWAHKQIWITQLPQHI
jgi:hypothetical protein